MKGMKQVLEIRNEMMYCDVMMSQNDVYVNTPYTYEYIYREKIKDLI